MFLQTSPEVLVFESLCKPTSTPKTIEGAQVWVKQIIKLSWSDVFVKILITKWKDSHVQFVPVFSQFLELIESHFSSRLVLIIPRRGDNHVRTSPKISGYTRILSGTSTVGSLFNVFFN